MVSGMSRMEASSVHSGPGPYFVLIPGLCLQAELPSPSLSSQAPLALGVGKQTGIKAEIQADFDVAASLPPPSPLVFGHPWV